VAAFGFVCPGPRRTAGEQVRASALLALKPAIAVLSGTLNSSQLRTSVAKTRPTLTRFASFTARFSARPTPSTTSSVE
jgi:hypothetical protein